MSRSRPRPFALAALLAASVLSAGPAVARDDPAQAPQPAESAQPAEPSRSDTAADAQNTPPWADTLADLASPDYHQRQAATRKLLRNNALTRDDLQAMFDQASNLEQRHRLLTVARHHVLRLHQQDQFDQPDRGSLGISHRVIQAHNLPPRLDADGAVIEIIATLPGFPAYAALQPGDLVVAVEGRPLPAEFTPQQFRALIIDYEKGDRLQLTIYREGQSRTRSVELASAQALSSMYDPSDFTLRPPFQHVWDNARQSLLQNAPTPSPPLTVPSEQTN